MQPPYVASSIGWGTAAARFMAADDYPWARRRSFYARNALGTGVTVIAFASLLIFSLMEPAGIVESKFT
jgi:hypothetical protein